LEFLEPWQLWSSPDLSRVAENTEHYCCLLWAVPKSPLGHWLQLGNKMNTTAWTKKWSTSSHDMSWARQRKLNKREEKP